MMKNPYYKGLVTYRGQSYPGNHEPLITVKTWERVQDLLETRGRSGEKVRRHHNYLKGTVWCGACGHRLIISMTKNRQGTVYPYLICIGRQQRRTNCTQKAVRIPDVERLVEEHYRTVAPERDLIEQMRNLLEEELANQRHHAEEGRQIQKRRVGALKDERHKLLEAHSADAVPLELLKTEQDRIGTELKHGQKRLQAVDVEFDQAETNMAQALESAADWNTAYLEAGPLVRRQLNQAVFKKIYVDDTHHVSSELAEPFQTLLGEEVTTAARARAETIDTEWHQVADKWTDQATEDLVATGAQVPQGLSFDTLVVGRGFEPSPRQSSQLCSLRPNRAVTSRRAMRR